MGAPSSSPDDGPVTSLRLVSWNMGSGRTRGDRRLDLDATLATLRSLRPDLIALQEVDRGQRRSGGWDQARLLNEELGMDWRYAPALLGTVGDRASWWSLAEGDPDPGTAAYGVALLCRLPMDAVAVSRLARAGQEEPRVALAARVRCGPHAVSLVNTHLSCELPAKVAQLRATRRLVTGMPPPRILAGDLNLRPQLVRAILGPGWRWAVKASTWSNRPGWSGLQLDYVLLHGGQLGLREPARVVDGPVSDHRVIVADLELPASRAP